MGDYWGPTKVDLSAEMMVAKTVVSTAVGLVVDWGETSVVRWVASSAVTSAASSDGRTVGRTADYWVAAMAVGLADWKVGPSVALMAGRSVGKTVA
jgi:hypothetical protein